MVIAIDGPAGAGKSTVARALAERLGFAYLDTGAMYRCVGLLALQAPAAEPAMLARESQIAFNYSPSGSPQGAAPQVLLNGRDVTGEIRAAEVAEAASRVAEDGEVRAALVARQRALVAQGDWVAEGRDIASAVAPEAELKVYLTADPAERARRRAEELGGEQGRILAEQALRDQRDSTLGRSALAPAPGAVAVDSTGLAIEQVVQQIVELAARQPA
ncbi:MAG TPA: (d)CMP kinase [Solirubrobacteraceae bacterium]|nr:(d)CMP kinase [Solirubrobacteraceae bacterium]